MNTKEQETSPFPTDFLRAVYNPRLYIQIKRGQIHIQLLMRALWAQSPYMQIMLCLNQLI